MIEEIVDFFGHRNITCLHNRSIEITKSYSLSLRGDCIAGVSADKGCSDLGREFKARSCESARKVFIEIQVDDLSYKIQGLTDTRLTLYHSDDIVIRKTNYVCPRTLCVHSDKSASDLPRRLVSILQNPNSKARLLISVE